jgi:hypothetical protein
LRFPGHETQKDSSGILNARNSMNDRNIHRSVTIET